MATQVSFATTEPTAHDRTLFIDFALKCDRRTNFYYFIAKGNIIEGIEAKW